MVLGLGCDIIQVARFQKWLIKDKLLRRYFTNQELQYVSNVPKDLATQRLAGMFAAKEAFIKSVMHAVKLTDIVIERNVQGAPRLRLERSALKALQQKGAVYSLVSISHERDYATATVVIGC